VSDPAIVEQVQRALGPAWQALLAQQGVIAAQQLIFAVVLFVLAGVCARLAEVPRREWMSEEGDSDEDAPLWAIGLYVCALLAFLPALALVLDGFGHLLNPSGYAVRGIIDGLGGRR
jgi:hypothetical protein